MSLEPLSHDNFVLLGALMTGGVAAYWVVVDSVRLRRALHDDRRDAAVRDRIFGSALGIVVGLIGVFGVLDHYYW